ncbi:MAG TPA: hypothetical protein VNA24_27470 [Hyalangium sp.]|nr:hypothetical protein [Hyalangium sp.]
MVTNNLRASHSTWVGPSSKGLRQSSRIFPSSTATQAACPLKSCLDTAQWLAESQPKVSIVPPDCGTEAIRF